MDLDFQGVNGFTKAPTEQANTRERMRDKLTKGPPPYALYFLREPGGNGCCVVGVSNDLAKVLSDKRNSTGHEYQIHQTFVFDNYRLAKRAEAACLEFLERSGANLGLGDFLPCALQEVCNVADAKLNGNAPSSPLPLDHSVSDEEIHVAAAPCVVYIVQQMGGHGACKVGVSRNLESRLRALRTGSPYKLEVCHVLSCRTRAVAERAETAAIKAIQDAGAELQGEWFQAWMLRGVYEAAMAEVDENYGKGCEQRRK